MYETAYDIETAAEILGCQPKKIMTEWAKGKIQVVLEFGKIENLSPLPWDYYSPPWNVADITAPLTVKFKEVELYCYEFSRSGFYMCPNNSREFIHEGSNTLRFDDALLFGYWALPHDEFLRRQIQESFTLKPHSRLPEHSDVSAIFTPGKGVKRVIAPDERYLRITESELDVLRELLPKRTAKVQEFDASTSSPQEAPYEHPHVERFAREREKVLAAALYVMRHHKTEVGKSFTSHANCIDKYRHLFWQGEAPPDPVRVAKMLSDTARTPEKWNILGGNAKKK